MPNIRVCLRKVDKLSHLPSLSETMSLHLNKKKKKKEKDILLFDTGFKNPITKTQSCVTTPSKFKNQEN